MSRVANEQKISDAATRLFLERGFEALTACARAIRDELSDLPTAALERCAKGRPHDPSARLAASLPLATWTVAISEAHRQTQVRP